MSYFYRGETAEFEYKVRVRPGPFADESVAEVHKQKKNGDTLKTIELKKTGDGTLALKLQDFQLDDSPLFVEFRFVKDDDKHGNTHAIALAEPVPAECTADPPEGDPGDSIKLTVTKWAALAHDQPGQDPTEFPEEKPERVVDDVKKSVKWKVAGEDLPDKGESVTFTVKKEHAGKVLDVEAFVGDEPPGRATTEVDCGQPVQLVLKDLADKPLANTKCQVVIEGDTKERTSDGDGLVKFRVPKVPVRAALRVDDPPPQFDLDIPVLVGKLDGVDTPRGQQARLRNLGYYFGPLADADAETPIDDDDPQTFKSAVEEFQCDQGLTISGDCDSATQDKLKELHGC